MRCRRYLIYLFLLCLSFACYRPAQWPQTISKEDKTEKEIDSLLRFEQNEAARNKAYTALKNINKNDTTKLSFLYSRIGKSYQYSFHFDSAVHYAKAAYDLSLQTNKKDIQAQQGVDLFRLYSQSRFPLYIAKKTSLFEAFNNLDKSKLTLKTQALILDALAEYYESIDRCEMSLYLANNELALYKKYLEHNIPDHQDSANIALCYVHISDGYLWINYFKSDDIDTALKHHRIKEGMRNLEMARKWIKKNSYLLSIYYHKMVYMKFIKEGKDIELPLLYRDSLVNLAKITGFNFNDYIIQANIFLSDIYYYHLDYDSQETINCWKYYNEAAKYDTNLIDPMTGGQLQWLKGDLFLREKKHDSALFTLREMVEIAKTFTLNKQINYSTSIAECFEGLGKIDSAILYYKNIMRFSDSLHAINEQKVVAEVKDKYQTKITQDKINVQNTIIKLVKREKLWLLGGIVLLSGFTVLLIVFFFRLRKQKGVLQYLNQQLNVANQTKTKLFGIISHDLRSPVNQVYQLLVLQQSKSIIIDPKEKAELEYKTQKAAAHLLDSMEDLLAWSKTQMQSLSIMNERVDISHLCNQCLGLLHTQIQEKKLKIEIHIPHDSTIETDTNFLLAILRNILHNAIKASPENGLIAIHYELSNTNDYVSCIKILNQGNLFTQQDYINALNKSQTSHLLRGGLGLVIIDELSREIGADVLYTNEGLTTCCNIIFKNKAGKHFK